MEKKLKKTLHFYYDYVEHLRALVDNEIPEEFGWKHHFSLLVVDGARSRAYYKLMSIARKHFPQLFLVTGWKGKIIELFGQDPSNQLPSFKDLSQYVKNESEEKRKEFFRDLYAMI